MYQRILVPVDLGDIAVAQPALTRAATMAKSSGGLLRLVNVLSMIPAAYLDYMPSNYDTQERDRAAADLAELAAKTGHDAGKVSTAIRLGAIYHEVLAEAKDWKADLIVIGSNAANIVRHAHCSVLVERHVA